MKDSNRKDVTNEFRGGNQGRHFTFAHVACFVIVTELKGLIDACGSTAGHCSPEKTLETQRMSFPKVLCHVQQHSRGLTAA